MKQDHFVKDLSNVARFLDGVAQLEKRGAREASIVLVVGKNGFGKSETLGWYAAQNPSVFITAKAAYTPGWMMNDFAQALGIKPAHRTEDTFNAVVAELVKQHTRNASFHIVVDEANEMLHDRRLLELLRQLCDFSGVPMIMGGHKGVETILKRHPAVYSRICRVVEFAPLSAEDVALLAKALIDASVDKDMIARIQQVTGGEARAIMNALARVEVFGRRSREKVTVENYGKRPLLSDESHREDVA